MKKFFLDKNDEIIYGVCSGVAKYANIDVTIVRVLFVIFLGYTIIPYFIAAIIAPSNED